jgi:hypothetical protein
MVDNNPLYLVTLALQVNQQKSKCKTKFIKDSFTWGGELFCFLNNWTVIVLES